MSSASRPKREAEEYARSQANNSKKPRFDYRNPSTLAADAPEEDLILDADVIGKSGTNTKRNAVNIDGYESDSDNDNFDARAREKARNKDKEAKSKDEEDDDMFADLAEDEQPDGDDDEEVGKKKGKDVRFLEQEEIEGQVMASEAGGKVSADILLDGKGKRKAQDEESESSGDEEERDQLPEEMDDEDAAELGAGSKKKHAPRLDAYNLKNEEEEGRFDESGNFVRKAQDPDAVNDNWLEGLSKKDMKKAKEAEEKREEERRRKAMEDDAVLTSDVLSRLITQLDTGETPLEALARLNKGKVTEKKVPKWKQKKQQKKNDGMEVDEPEANGNGTADPKEEARKKAVDAITAAADALYSRGQHEIYQAEREILMRQYRRETGEDWKPSPTEAETGAATGGSTSDAWEYRWSDARDGGSSHGPYDGPTMQAWNEAGYFGEGVEFRRISSSSEWSRILDIS